MMIEATLYKNKTIKNVNGSDFFVTSEQMSIIINWSVDVSIKHAQFGEMLIFIIKLHHMIILRIEQDENKSWIYGIIHRIFGIIATIFHDFFFLFGNWKKRRTCTLSFGFFLQFIHFKSFNIVFLFILKRVRFI